MFSRKTSDSATCSSSSAWDSQEHPSLSWLRAKIEYSPTRRAMGWWRASPEVMLPFTRHSSCQWLISATRFFLHKCQVQSLVIIVTFPHLLPLLQPSHWKSCSFWMMSSPALVAKSALINILSIIYKCISKHLWVQRWDSSWNWEFFWLLFLPT